jgi:hypothetical protein
MNKQEFSGSSWRSNQGYTKMHGQPTIKICNAKQARQIYQYKKVTIPEAAHIQLRRGPPDDEQG